ncbi:hypothetical protein [Aquimarina sp. 2201CG14-23]|uniref:hypothetical protein n=1 Tax=Aquimarina mycalae TaxID=3040073 RepID=UPI002477EAEE|nr:hypothetical protein [Aquimarina sp. 2201CG14-23]MDH7444326.1 hypothetical protein [Aquimarina sp. 2201CG14-23]
MKKVSLLIALCLTIFSCSKEGIITEEELVLENVLTKTFVYESNEYTVQFNGDGEPVESGVSEKLLRAISSSNVVEIGNEDIFYLFDDINEMNTFIQEKTATFAIEGDMSKVAGIARSTGYQHENYLGFPLGGSGNFAYPSLRPHGFNDLISSCIVTNQSSRAYLAQYFEHDNYRGRVYNVVLSPGQVKAVPNMRSVGLHDKVSSMIGRYL